RGRRAAGGVVEGHGQGGLDVGPAPGSGARRLRAAATLATAAEQVADQVRQVRALEAGPTGSEPARTAEAGADGAHAADLVVLLALVGVADHLVGGRDLLEALLGDGVVGVGVGVQLTGELTVGL